MPEEAVVAMEEAAQQFSPDWEGVACPKSKCPLIFINVDHLKVHVARDHDIGGRLHLPGRGLLPGHPHVHHARDEDERAQDPRVPPLPEGHIRRVYEGQPRTN